MRKLTRKAVIMGVLIPSVGITLFNIFVHVYPLANLVGVIILLISFMILYLGSDSIKSTIGIPHNIQYTIYTLVSLGITFYLYFSNEEIDKLTTLGDIVGLGFLLVCNGFLYVEGRMDEESN